MKTYTLKEFEAMRRRDRARLWQAAAQVIGVLAAGVYFAFIFYWGA